MWEDAFFEAYAQVGNMTDAAQRAGVAGSTARMAKLRHPEFALRLEGAEREFCDRLRREIYRRGVVGWDEPQFGTVRDAQGHTITAQVGNKRVFSDRMLELLAKARMPEEFGERIRVDVREKARYFARKLGATPEEEEAAVAEAERLLAEEREEQRRRV